MGNNPTMMPAFPIRNHRAGNGYVAGPSTNYFALLADASSEPSDRASSHTESMARLSEQIATTTKEISMLLSVSEGGDNNKSLSAHEQRQLDLMVTEWSDSVCSLHEILGEYRLRYVQRKLFANSVAGVSGRQIVAIREVSEERPSSQHAATADADADADAVSLASSEPFPRPDIPVPSVSHWALEPVYTPGPTTKGFKQLQRDPARPRPFEWTDDQAVDALHFKWFVTKNLASYFTIGMQLLMSRMYDIEHTMEAAGNVTVTAYQAFRYMAALERDAFPDGRFCKFDNEKWRGRLLEELQEEWFKRVHYVDYEIDEWMDVEMPGPRLSPLPPPRPSQGISSEDESDSGLRTKQFDGPVVIGGRAPQKTAERSDHEAIEEEAPDAEDSLYAKQRLNRPSRLNKFRLQSGRYSPEQWIKLKSQNKQECMAWKKSKAARTASVRSGNHLRFPIWAD